MNKEKFSLKYPQKFAISRCHRKIALNEDGSWKSRVIIYPVPCYVLEDHKKYDENGGVKQSARVLMQWERVDEPDGGTTIKAKGITNENYRSLIREKTIYVDRLFETYEECKIEVEKENDKNIEQEKLEALYSGESVRDGLLKADMVTIECKNEQNKLISAADELYQKTLGNNAATNSTKDKKLDGSVAQGVMKKAFDKNKENPVLSDLNKYDDILSDSKTLKVGSNDGSARTLVDDDGQNEFCC